MDTLTTDQRAKAMRAVKSTGSAAELGVRRLCRLLGHPGYRLHRRDIVGTPDLTFVGRRLAIFVHGCFWHGHSCKAGSKAVKTNATYWQKKISRNIERDKQVTAALGRAGWKIIVVWECELKDVDAVKRRLTDFLTNC